MRNYGMRALAIATAYLLSRLGPRAGTASLAIAVAIALTHVDHWYESLVEQDWRGAVAYVEARKQPGEPLVVHPDWLSPSVEFYAAEEPARGSLSGSQAWVVSLAERAPEVEQLAADSKYAIAESRNFVSVQVWRVVKP